MSSICASFDADCARSARKAVGSASSDLPNTPKSSDSDGRHYGSRMTSREQRTSDAPLSPARVVVWGTGNVGMPAIRAVRANPLLELVGVIVSSDAKNGRDVGDLAGTGPMGVTATTDIDAVLATKPDAVVYTASGDFRPVEAITDVLRCLGAGCNVVTPSIYPLYHPPSAPPELIRYVEGACAQGNSTLFASGIDPGWALDLLPIVLSGVAGSIDEIRMQEIFNYASYHAPDAVRDLVGFGTPLDRTPPMLEETALQTVWGAMVRLVADALDVELDDVTTWTDRLPLAETVDVPGMGRFDAGTQGAMRFEVRGMVKGKARIVVEHVTRIIDDIAPDWPVAPPGRQGAHRVIISGQPSIEVTICADDGSGNSAEGGNATAAGRLVHAIPAVVAAAPGIVTTLDLPLIIGRGLLG
jgi:2,4-diaminopentanoate dehydrogenase